MIITRLYVENLYCFKSTELDLSYTRFPLNERIDSEYLEDRPKFYFKKVCILSGANATGKTSLGKILLGIQLFITRVVIDNNYLVIGNHDVPARFTVDFVIPSTNNLYRVDCYLRRYENVTYVTSLNFGHVYIRQNDSCRVATKRLTDLFSRGIVKTDHYSLTDSNRYVSSDAIGIVEAQNVFKDIFGVNNFGWHYVFSENDESSSSVHDIKVDILKKILMTFDPSVTNVVQLIAENDKNKKKRTIEGFSVRFKNGEAVVIGTTGKPDDPNRLSRGTFESIKVARLLSRIISDYDNDKHNDYGITSTYFLDEKMAFAHTELEQLILTILISKLSRYSQLFYTTHNVDVLDLNLPAHSYTFIKKESDNAIFIEALSLAKKNDRSLRSLVQNNCFGTKPDDELLFEILSGE